VYHRIVYNIEVMVCPLHKRKKSTRERVLVTRTDNIDEKEPFAI